MGGDTDLGVCLCVRFAVLAVCALLPLSIVTFGLRQRGNWVKKDR